MDLVDWILTNPTVPVVITGTAIAYFSLRSQQHLTRAKHTLDFDKEFKDKHKSTLIDAKQALDNKSWAELRRLGAHGKISQNLGDDFTAIVNAINIWEGVAIGLKNKVYVEEQFIEAYGSTIVWLYKNTIPFVRARQEENERLFAHFTWLGIRWSSMLALPLQLEREKEEKERLELKAREEALMELRTQINNEILAEIEATDRPHSRNKSAT